MRTTSAPQLYPSSSSSNSKCKVDIIASVSGNNSTFSYFHIRYFDGSSNSFTDDGNRNLASIRSEYARLATDELSRQNLESNIFNQRGGNANALYSAALTGQNRGVMEQKNTLYDRSNTFTLSAPGHALTLSPTSAFRLKEDYEKLLFHISKLFGKCFSGLKKVRIRHCRDRTYRHSHHLAAKRWENKALRKRTYNYLKLNLCA